MGTFSKVGNVTLLFENLSKESTNLVDTFRNIGVNANMVCMEDDGFLPDGVISPYGFFLEEYDSEGVIEGKPLYFNQVSIPKYWEIEGNGSGAKVMDVKKERARMFFTKTDNTRLVKIVDWYGENGKARLSEHYNKYGRLFCKTVFNSAGQKFSRTFFNRNGEEIIYENFVTTDIMLRWKDKDYIFKGNQEFMKFFFKCSGLEETNIIFNSLSHPFFVSDSLPQNGYSDALFWNEPINGEIPGNMQFILNGNARRAKKIYVQRHESYQKLMELGASPEMVKELGYVYNFTRENEHRPNALIITNSDNIEKLTEIVEAVPNMHFYIAAITEMSSKLMSMDRYKNVSLFPGVKKNVVNILFDKCDLYVDINHEGEVLDAVNRAFLNKMLIIGFDSTVHNKNYVAPTNIFEVGQYGGMIAALNAIIDNPELIDMALKQQMEYALAEDADKYDINGIF